MTKVIWVDLDEVLAELLDLILEYNNYKIWNYSLNKNDIKYYYIHKMDNLDISLEEAISWFRKPMLEDINNFEIKPTVWSFEKLKEFKNKWYKLLVITARIEEIFWDYTKKWIGKYFPETFDDIIFANHFHEKHKDKSEICNDLWVNYMIEDNFDYALDVANAWIKTYLLEKPWNSHILDKHENIVRFNSWPDLDI